MIQRLVREGLVEPLDVEKETPVYAKYSASNLRTKLKSMKADTNNDGVKDRMRNFIGRNIRCRKLYCWNKNK